MNFFVGLVVTLILIATMQLITLFLKSREYKKVYSVFINDKLETSILFGEKDSYFNRVKYRSTIKMTVNEKERKINIYVDFI